MHLCFEAFCSVVTHLRVRSLFLWYCNTVRRHRNTT